MYEMNIMVFILSQMGHLAGVPFQDTKGPYIDEPACEARKVEFMAVTDEVKKNHPWGENIQFVYADCQPIEEVPEAFSGDVVG